MVMNKYLECPKCKRTKYRIIKEVCQSCYCIAFNKDHRPSRKHSIDIEISDLQKEFITGSLLGDAWISNLKYGRQSPCFGVDRKRDDLKYLKWQYEFIKNLCLRPIVLRERLNKTTNKTHKHCSFETRYLPSLLEFRKLWYPSDIKVIPSELKLTKLIMQIWYCDDGSLEIFESGKFRIKFAAHGFSKDENLFLIDLLEDRYCEKFSLNKDRDKWIICANVKTAPIIIEDLKNEFPSGMKRKMIK
jgi:hypothetical protein